MNDKLPIFDELDRMTDDSARADWLIRLPLSLMMTYQHAIRRRFAARQWPEATDYLETVVTACRSVRDKSGLMHVAGESALMAARTELQMSVVRRAKG